MSLSQTDLKLIDSMLRKRIEAAAVSIGKNLEERVRAAKEHLEAGTWEVLDQIEDYKQQLEEEGAK